MTSASNPQQPSRGLLDYLLTAAMLACFLAAGWHFTGNDVSQAAISTSNRLDETAEVPKTETKLKTTSIEDIRLGQRVTGRNPLREQTQSPSDITPENWRAIKLTMHAYGVRYDLAFLRSLDWLQATGAEPGTEIHLSLPEMGLDGPALVESIDACPPIERDDGTGRMIVTGTMRHPASNILDVSITGMDEPLGVTDTHPIWSDTRQTFITAGQLQPGEHLRSETGVISQVTRITPRRGPPELTYNLEIDGEHVYHVAESGLLVHNACPGESASELMRRLGQEGEQLLGVPKNTKHISSLSGTAKYRIPDGLTDELLIEAKNVKNLSFTSQLQDSLHHSIESGRTMILQVREGTTLSAPLQRAVDAGWIKLERVL